MPEENPTTTPPVVEPCQCVLCTTPDDCALPPSCARITLRETYYGGDPRDFHPDPECSTDAERQAHREACAAWDRGEQVEAARGGCAIDPTFTSTDRRTGETHTGPAIVCRSGAFGLGTGYMDFEVVRAPCPKLAEHVGTGEGCSACVGYGYIDHF